VLGALVGLVAGLLIGWLRGGRRRWWLDPLIGGAVVAAAIFLVPDYVTFDGFAGGGTAFVLTVAIVLAVFARHLRTNPRAEAERVAADQRDQAEEERRRLEKLVQDHRIPPTEPVVALGSGEKELTRFWTRLGAKGLLTTRRLIFERADGSLMLVPVTDIQGLSMRRDGPYQVIIQTPTPGDPDNGFGMSSQAEADRVFGVLRSAVLTGGQHVPRQRDVR
jgi:hypothetical protein